MDGTGTKIEPVSHWLRLKPGEPTPGIEPGTPALRKRCSTAELSRRKKSSYRGKLRASSDTRNLLRRADVCIARSRALLEATRALLERVRAL